MVQVQPGHVWFGIPTTPPGYVRRQRLLEQLELGRGRRLVLVSAPAGCGKTSLVADWVRVCGDEQRTAWATLEPGDGGVWPGLLGGLARLGVAPGLEAPAPGTPVDRTRLADLAAAVAARDRRVRVVVDGAEVVSASVGNDLDFLLRHSADRLQLVLITRSDPVMPLYRYRLEGTLSEVRMADLACNDEEAAGLLAASGVRLGCGPLRELNTRAQGWVVGLRFAARHLAEVADPAAAVRDVVGDRGDIAEYLLGEVLDAQTPEVRRLLLSTSVADVLRPGLTETLGGSSVGRTLELLTRENAFVEPVPEHPGFYRYHPFFRDLLRAELAHESPATLERLQHAAAAWYASRDMPAQSVRHLVAAGDWVAAASEVVDQMLIGDLLRAGGPGTLRGMFTDQPSGLPTPATALVAATTLLADGDLPGSRCELARARSAMDPATPGSAAVEVAVAVLDALHARRLSGPDELDARCEAALRALEASDVPAHVATELGGLVDVGRAQARMRQGRLEDARALLVSTVRRGTASGRELVEMECLGHLAVLACLRGELSVAAALATRALRAAERAGVAPTEQSASSYLALAWVDLALDDVASAGDHVALASLSDFLAGDPVSCSLLTVLRTRLQRTRGPAPAPGEPDASGARAAALAPLDEADPWVVELLRSDPDVADPVREGDPATAGRRGDRTPRPGSGSRADDRRPAAVVPSQRSGSSGAPVPPVDSVLPAELVESLTPKEQEVLEHLALLLTTDEIATAMVVSVNTVRTHVRNILRKLGVSRRNAAVRRARELNLLAA